MAKKYDAIADYLYTSLQDEWVLSFRRIEEIIGSSLPSSARTYQAWWSNTSVPGRQSEAWLNVGWQTTNLNLKARHVTFRRLPDAPFGFPEDRRPSTKPAPVSLAIASVAPDCKIALQFTWRSLGEIAVHDDGSLVFPTVANVPGLYRFRIEGVGRSQFYIGEAAALARRFAHYRRPGPTQQTNIRLNALLKAMLAQGSKVAVDIACGEFELRINGTSVAVDLNNKATRRMAEHAAIVACGGLEVEMVNR